MEVGVGEGSGGGGKGRGGGGRRKLLVPGDFWQVTLKQDY